MDGMSIAAIVLAIIIVGLLLMSVVLMRGRSVTLDDEPLAVRRHPTDNGN